MPELADGYVCADIDRNSCGVQLTKLQEAVEAREAATERLAAKAAADPVKP